MFVWEVLAHRLRQEGWRVWQTSCRDARGITYLVHLARGGSDCLGSGPTLTEALADATRRVRETRIDSAEDPRASHRPLGAAVAASHVGV
jgi:hypothetical protein